MDWLNSLRVVTNIHFVGSQYTWCTIKQNTTKRGKPLHFKDPFSIENQFHSFWELHHGHTLGCPLFNLLYLWKSPPYHHPYPNQTQTENKITFLRMVQIKDLKELKKAEWLAPSYLSPSYLVVDSCKFIQEFTLLLVSVSDVISLLEHNNPSSGTL